MAQYTSNNHTKNDSCMLYTGRGCEYTKRRSERKRYCDNRGGMRPATGAGVTGSCVNRDAESGRDLHYFPRRTAIVYASGSRTEAARRFTSEMPTAAIFSGAENVSSYPVPYSSL
jgi:hypothetical protein